MKNLKRNLGSVFSLLAAGSLFLATSCSETNEDDVFVDESNLLESTEELESTAVGTFDLGDFQIETSWLTGENSRTTNSFTATSKDNESWYDKNSSGLYVLRSLRTDGNRTEWKERPGRESALGTSKRMRFRATVNSIPENGVTIAQVHNRGNGVRRPFLRVYIDDDRRMKIKVTTNNPSNSSGTYQTFTGPLYTQGTKLFVNIKHTGGKVWVKLSGNGNVYTRTITPSSGWNNFRNSYYYKAGVYTEGNDKQPKITFDYFDFKR